MVLKQLKLGDKVKLQLIQPMIKCSGRDNITCFYRGRIIEKLEDSLLIEFKYNREIKRELYYISGPLSYGFYLQEIKDIKII